MNMQDKPISRQPIGYWLKRGHDALENRLNTTLESQGLTRNHWQVLNLLYEADAPLAIGQIAAQMQTFVDAKRLESILADFTANGWLTRSADTIALTDTGRAARGQVFAVISEVRAQAVQGITPEAYATVIESLQKLVSNME